jgi:glutamate dehydrogenase/leucine dehydrogenase
MKKAFKNVLDRSQKENIDMRRAALAIAVQRVAAAMKLSGWH